VTHTLASVSADDVRDAINITSEEIPDNKILKMIKRAEVTLELETDKQVDSSNCSDAEKEVDRVRMVIKEVTGIYRKRIAGTKQAFLSKQEYGAIIDAADTTKLAKIIRILGFLTQTEVYLFWKKG